MTDFYSKVIHCPILSLIFLFNTLAAQPPIEEPGQPWPKRMQLFEGRLMDVKQDSNLINLYLDWQGRRFPDTIIGYHRTKTKYLYIDSTGKPLSDKRYIYASHFREDLAIVILADTIKKKDGDGNTRTDVKWRWAVITTKEDEVLPMSETIKSLSAGLIVEKRHDTMSVYNRKGKKIAECPHCELGFVEKMGRFWMTPPYYAWRSPEEKVVKLMDLEGKVLYSSPGIKIELVVNSLGSDNKGIASIQPYYNVTSDVGSTILDRNGRVVMDSISMFSFRDGKCRIVKNGVAAIVDTNWKLLVPFSYGYTYIETPAHQDAYIAWKDNRCIVINADNKQLIPLESSRGISYRYKCGYYYYEAYDKEGNLFYVNTNGDTLVNPIHYQVVGNQNPYVPGFFVQCKSNGLKGYLDEHGKVAIPCLYDNLLHAGGDLIIFFGPDGSSGYMDTQGHVKFSNPGLIKLTTFDKGYARCVIKVTDRKQFKPDQKTFRNGKSSCQFQQLIIDSTGNFVIMETWPAIVKNFNQLLPDGSHIVGYFYKGVAVTYNKKKNKYGLVNEKLELIVPAIYDKIDSRVESFNYQWCYIDGSGPTIGVSGTIANIINGNVKIILKGVEKVISVGK